MGKKIYFRAQCCQKYALYPKLLQIKVVQHWIPYKKNHWAHASFSHQSEAIRLCMEFNVQQLAIWSIFSYNAHFWRRRAPNWIYFSISVQYNIWNISVFGALRVHSGWRYVRPLTFLYRIQCSTNFIWTIFGYNAYFWQRRALNWVYFLIFVHYILKMAIFSLLAPLLG